MLMCRYEVCLYVLVCDYVCVLMYCVHVYSGTVFICTQYCIYFCVLRYYVYLWYLMCVYMCVDVCHIHKYALIIINKHKSYKIPSVLLESVIA